MERIYESLLDEHLRANRQMAFLAGPRQVGKTTSAQRSLSSASYFNWDRQADRLLITRGSAAIDEKLRSDSTQSSPFQVIFDEIHKYSKWKNFLKGFFDVHGEDCRIIVTGSARLNIRKRGGDSLMGRYFLYRMHPLTVAELGSIQLLETEIREGHKVDRSTLEPLLEFGGFPEPFIKASVRFYNRWKRLRLEQLFHEDLRDLTQIHEAAQVEVLAQLLADQAGQLVNYSSLAVELNVAVDTIRRWISVLESLYYCFLIRPWFRNVPKSLRKQPKVYLWDWSLLKKGGSRHENFVASHLLKAVHWWTDLGLGDYGLYYLRDKAKREVDFLVTRNQEPWFVVESKSGGKRGLNPSLDYYHQLLNAEHAFQVDFDQDYIDRNCFAHRKPVQIPVLSLLSQLV